MDLPTNAGESRVSRLAALEDEIRRRLWDRERDGNRRAFDEMVTDIAREQYAKEGRSRRSGFPVVFGRSAV